MLRRYGCKATSSYGEDVRLRIFRDRDVKNIGTELFQKVFHARSDARFLWATLRQKLDDTRVEINTPPSAISAPLRDTNRSISRRGAELAEKRNNSVA